MNNRYSRPIIVVVTVILACLQIPSLSFAFDPYNIREAQPPLVTDEGVLFSYKAPSEAPRYVMVSGDFNNWEHPLLMTKNRYDVFLYFLNETKEKAIVLKDGKYRYRYLVEGVWMNDAHNDKTMYDNSGTELSYFEVFRPIILPERNPTHIDNNSYIFYYENGEAEEVYIVGDFNNWNPYSHSLKKNKTGLWEVELDIPPGTYAYRFIVDGVFRPDPLGEIRVSDKFDNELSQITLPR
jgi:1,4-alpha-glucan branching enzyme